MNDRDKEWLRVLLGDWCIEWIESLKTGFIQELKDVAIRVRKDMDMLYYVPPSLKCNRLSQKGMRKRRKWL